jgi:hypothetical protein
MAANSLQISNDLPYLQQLVSFAKRQIEIIESICSVGGREDVLDRVREVRISLIYSLKPIYLTFI